MIEIKTTTDDLIEEIADRESATLLVAADMSQLELRISAYMSRDPVMMDILRSGRDMHCVTAAAIYGVDEHRCKRGCEHIGYSGPGVTDAMRNTAKVVNYLTSYGGKAGKMIEGIEKMVLEHPEMGLSVPTLQEANHALKTHRRLYAQYWRWVGWTIIRTREKGYSETAFGRPRFIPDIDHPDDAKRAEAERQAVNHCIQGTAADLMKMAMVNIARDDEMSKVGEMVLQVHDEIVSIVAREAVAWYKDRIRQHMELGQPFEPYVKLIVDVESAFTWAGTHK